MGNQAGGNCIERDGSAAVTGLPVVFSRFGNRQPHALVQAFVDGLLVVFDLHLDSRCNWIDSTQLNVTESRVDFQTTVESVFRKTFTSQTHTRKTGDTFAAQSHATYVFA